MNTIPVYIGRDTTCEFFLWNEEVLKCLNSLPHNLEISEELYTEYITALHAYSKVQIKLEKEFKKVRGNV